MKRYKIGLIKTGAVIFIIAVLLNFVLGTLLRNTINNRLKKFNNSSDKEIVIEKIRLNIWAGTLVLKNIYVVPDSAVFEQFKQGGISRKSITEIRIPFLKISNPGVFNLLIGHELSINKVLIRGSKITIYKNKLNGDSENKRLRFSPDSIHIAWLNSVGIHNVKLKSFGLTTIDINTNDTVFSYSCDNFKIKEIVLDKTTGEGNVFKLNTKKLLFAVEQQYISLKKENYVVSVDKLNLSFEDELVTVSGFKLNPSVNKYKLGASSKFTKNVFDVDINSGIFLGCKLTKVVTQGVIDVDSIFVDGMNIDIYKDRRLPFDMDQRPLLIQQQLKILKQPLYIKSISFRNSNFNFSLRPEDSDKLLQVDIQNISGNVDFITSIKDSLQSDKKLEMNLSGDLMGTFPLKLNVVMPYNSPVDSFYFAGELGGGDFVKLNPALYPATGIEFDGGQLNYLTFYAHADSKTSVGQMTMLYSNLKARIPQKDTGEKSKFLSFGANTALRISNPTKKGKTRISQIKTKRIEYKGFGNFIWKAVQSGLINTILPTGKSHVDKPMHKSETRKKKQHKREP